MKGRLEDGGEAHSAGGPGLGGAARGAAGGAARGAEAAAAAAAVMSMTGESRMEEDMCGSASTESIFSSFSFNGGASSVQPVFKKCHFNFTVYFSIS